MTDTPTVPTPWWRRRRTLVVAIVVLAVVVGGLLVRQATRPTDLVDEPVTASSLDRYPARGSLDGAGDGADEVEDAADVWRAESPGGREQPPDRDERIELLWAGDVDADELEFETRFMLRLEDAGRETAPRARMVVLRAAEHLALLLAPLDDAGRRTADFVVVGDATVDRLDTAALSPAEGVVLLAEDYSDHETVPVAFPAGVRDVAEDDVAEGDTAEGDVQDWPVHDGLLLGARGGVTPRTGPTSASGDDPALVLTSSGATIAVDGDALWGALTDEAAAGPTWTALGDAVGVLREHDPSRTPFAEIWDPVSLDDGPTLWVVAVREQSLRADTWWSVSGAFAQPAPRDEPRAVRLGAGPTPFLGGAGSAAPPLAARWVSADGLGTDAPALVVASGPGVTGAVAVTASGPRDLPGGVGAITAWEERDGVPTTSPVAVVGTDTDGEPVSPLPTRP